MTLYEKYKGLAVDHSYFDLAPGDSNGQSII